MNRRLKQQNDNAGLLAQTEHQNQPLDKFEIELIAELASDGNYNIRW